MNGWETESTKMGWLNFWKGTKSFPPKKNFMDGKSGAYAGAVRAG